MGKMEEKGSWTLSSEIFIKSVFILITLCWFYVCVLDWQGKVYIPLQAQSAILNFKVLPVRVLGVAGWRAEPGKEEGSALPVILWGTGLFDF
jgi:hypothetical protein